VAADYSTGELFHYSYDAVGNRLTQDTLAGTNTYTYDIANRLVEVDGVPYTWDANGNLLDDGLREYAYDHANRLISVEMGDDSFEFGYSGLGDRLRQTVNGEPIEYTLDLAAGLTQVLSDGDNAYFYGAARIGEKQPDGWQYHLGDALGSSRQLTDFAGDVILADSYEPYGDTLSSTGRGFSVHQFTGEMRDPTGLTFLRARYLDTAAGRFINRDAWGGEYTKPHSLNRWNYVEANPIMYVDPSGQVCLDPWAPAGFHLDLTRGCDYPDGGRGVLFWRATPTCPPQTPTFAPTPGPTPSRRFDQVIFICGRGEGPACANRSAPLHPFREMAERNGYSASDFTILDVDVCGTKLECANEAISRIGASGMARFLLIGHSAGGSAVIIAVDRVSDKGRIAGIVLLDPSMNAELEGGIEPNLQSMADNLPKPVFLGDSPEDGDDRIAGALEVTYPELGHNELALTNKVVEDMLDAFGWNELK
jgi:RHS repeat-associated protein